MILYSTSCPQCKVLKDKLDKLQIEYTICSDTNLMIKKGFMSVPILEIDNKIMTFSEALRWLNEGVNNI